MTQQWIMPSLMKGVIVNACQALALTMQNFTKEDGTAFAPPVQLRAAYSDALPTYPNVTVAYQPGGSEEGLGQNLIGIDQDTGTAYYAQYDDGGTLRITIRAKRESERIWIHDWFDNSLRADFVSDSSTGESIPGAVQLYLLQYGIQVNGIRGPEKPPPALEDPRPSGQRWDITLVVDVDVALAWSHVIPAGVNKIAAITFNPVVATPDGRTITDPPTTVNAGNVPSS
ncbi:MAG: hypothetical protein JWO59_738 [Chloroflexi bacterium]|nr:hypothetical protein [Chloroflexota bacterium]